MFLLNGFLGLVGLTNTGGLGGLDRLCFLFEVFKRPVMSRQRTVSTIELGYGRAGFCLLDDLDVLENTFVCEVVGKFMGACGE